MIILLPKFRFSENFMENNAFYVFRYQLIIKEVLFIIWKWDRDDVTRPLLPQKKRFLHETLDFAMI